MSEIIVKGRVMLYSVTVQYGDVVLYALNMQKV